MWLPNHSRLVASALREQSNAAISELHADNADLQTAREAMNAFVADNTNIGDSFDNVRLNMEDYLRVANAFENANNADISDHGKLINVIGDENLCLATINSEINVNINEGVRVRNRIAHYERVRNSTTWWERRASHAKNVRHWEAGASLRTYRGIERNLNDTIEYLRGRIELFNHIEDSTKNLFTTGPELRSEAINGIKLIEEAAIGLPYSYGCPLLSTWRADIVISTAEFERKLEERRFSDLVERLEGSMAEADLILFKQLYEMNRERAISYLLLYEEMMLTLPQDISPSIAGQYLVHLIEHVRNRVNAEAFMLDFGAGRVFTEDEVLYLGVILRFQRPENVNLNGSIWEQYLVQVSPFLDGLTFFGIPDHLVPLHMYPTENSQNLFDRGRKWSPIATALLFAFAGLGDMGRGMNAALNAPPAKPTGQGGTNVPRLPDGTPVPGPRTIHQVKTGRVGELPVRGRPNSSIDLRNNNGDLLQRRFFDKNGRVEMDIDFRHGDAHANHMFPHQHNWRWENGTPIRD
ncbi:MAG: hypothetical protein FWD05_02455 [Oscillospiraceae bacterium]|nr:hypothetical protein [Oscillospiraceae bacterium]